MLRNAIEQAAAQRQDEYCWKLAWDWAPLLKRRGMLHEVLAVQRTAVLAAGRLGDRDALAHVHYELGHASGRLGDYAAADEHLLQALDLFTELGDQASVGRVRHGLAQLLTVQGRYDEALDHAVEALRLRRASAGSAAIAYSENAVGWILAHLGQADAALWYCRRALEMHTRVRQPHRHRRHPRQHRLRLRPARRLRAVHRALRAALEMYRLLGDLQGEAASRLAPRRRAARLGAAGRRPAQLGAGARAARPDSRRGHRRGERAACPVPAAGRWPWAVSTYARQE